MEKIYSGNHYLLYYHIALDDTEDLNSYPVTVTFIILDL